MTKYMNDKSLTVAVPRYSDVSDGKTMEINGPLRYLNVTHGTTRVNVQKLEVLP